MSPILAILGAGPAGLAAGYSASVSHTPFRIYEAAGRAGGNCRTLTQGGFRFDTGAHRFHDKYPDVTAAVRALLGDELAGVSAPSRIACNGRYVDFPLSPLNALAALGPARASRAALDFVRARLRQNGHPASFEDFALATYGRTLAEMFLLGYSEKLWGRPCSNLSPDIAGARLKGLTLPGLVTEAVLGRSAHTKHLDGTFLYPRLGIGRLTDRLAEACGPDQIRLDARVTRVVHEGGRLSAIEINGRERIGVGAVINSLPLGPFVSMLDPAPPGPVLDAASRLRFRQLVLVTVFVDRPSITPCATVYFPDPALPFTRVSEPRNRSVAMAPPGQTSLMAEITCDASDDVWSADDVSLVQRVSEALCGIGWIRPSDVIGAHVHRLANAYPLLDTDAGPRVRLIERYLAEFPNLRLTGRIGRFAYSHLHDQMLQGREAVEALAPGRANAS